MEAALGRGTNLSSEYSPYLPVDLLQTLLVDIHEYAGCSWFTAIVCSCIGIRALILPVSIAAIRGGREKAILQPEYEKLMQQQKAVKLDGDPEKNNRIQKKIQNFTQKHGKLFMMKGTWNLIFVQLPLYVTAFAAMRGMANRPDLFRGFAMEAPLWLDSLALADPYYVLPVLTSAIMITNQELFGSVDTEAPTTESTSETPGGPSTMERYSKYFSRGSALVFIPFTAGFPSGVFIFMCTNMITAALQNRVLRNPAVERWLEIPPRKSEAAAAAAAAAVATPAPSSARGVALTNLGMTLKRPKNSLLGTPQSFQPVKPSVPSVPFAKAPLPNATAAFQSGQGGQGQSKAGIERLAELSGGRFAVKRMEKQL